MNDDGLILLNGFFLEGDILLVNVFLRGGVVLPAESRMTLLDQTLVTVNASKRLCLFHTFPAMKS
mgnify:CR=1 FL=1